MNANERDRAGRGEKKVIFLDCFVGRYFFFVCSVDLGWDYYFGCEVVCLATKKCLRVLNC